MRFRIVLSALALLGALGPALAYEDPVEKKTFTMPSYTTVGGRTIKEVRVGYETYGRLNAAGDNAILIPHFFFGNSHMAGRYKPSDPQPGIWDAIIGPGKPIDTDRFFVLSVDSLANINARDGVTVTTGPASTNPETGKPYGLTFPTVQIRDFVNVQKAVADQLGVKRFHAVIGPSMGAMQAFEWAAGYPEMVERLVAVVGTPQVDAYTIERVRHWADAIKLDPRWNGGDYYGREEPTDGLLLALRIGTLDARAPAWAEAMFSRKWADAGKDPAASPDNLFAVEKWFDDTARARAKTVDANHLIYLARAVELFSVGGQATLEDGLKPITAKVLLIPAKSDVLLFPEYSRRAKSILEAQGKSVEYVEIEGPLGHNDGLFTIAKAGEAIKGFLGR